MKRLILAALLIVALPLSTALSPVFGQEDEAEEGYSFGYVVQASAGNLVLKETDFETDEEEMEVSYVIDDETILENFQALSELAAGEEVEIIYVEEDGRKKARRIARIDEDMWDDSGDDVDGAGEETAEDSRV